MYKIFLYTLMLLFYSCGNKTRSEKNNGGGEFGQDVMYTCPVCNGSGIFEYMPGDVMSPREICKGCNGNKVVNEQQYRSLMQVKNQFNQSTGVQDINTVSSGRSAFEIEMEIEKAYELLQSMQEQYENCSSVVLKSQYPRMIREQEELIRQLQNELRYAQ